MYWILLLIYIVSILIPDIIRGPIYNLPEVRAEEAAIFISGAIAFLVFLKFEQIVNFLRKEKEKDQKKINQAVKDLVESYSYIGEVNRKMDILMNIALGLTDRSVLNKKREKEIYESIVSAVSFLMKSTQCSLRFVNLTTGRTEKEISTDKTHSAFKNKDLTKMDDETNVLRNKDTLVVSSSQTINNIKSYLIIKDYDQIEDYNPKNIEILKVFASQSIFVFSYVNPTNKTNSHTNN